MRYTVDSGLLDSSWSVLMETFSETGACVLLYGIYINLFLFSVYILARRRETHGMKLLMAWSCVIAAVATTQMAVAITQAVETARSVEHLLHGQVLNSPVLIAVKTAQIALVAMNNFVSDSLYLYRCYAIWGCRWKIVILPGLLLLSTFGQPPH
ncbi:hypothetical protein B0H12DRAFT_711264 [Mycena haematopus]|nr:hypothetical protein B0H12DRAFT_711264 [Mycena haematopus]